MFMKPIRCNAATWKSEKITNKIWRYLPRQSVGKLNNIEYIIEIEGKWKRETQGQVQISENSKVLLSPGQQTTKISKK